MERGWKRSLAANRNSSNAVRFNWIFLAAFLAAALGARAQTQPTITQDLTNQTILVDSNVTLSVSVSGTGPFSYQWFFNSTPLAGIISTVAGNGSYGYSGDGSVATNAALRGPSGLAFDAAGNFFIADYHNDSIRKVDSNGVIITVAGNGSPGYSGDGPSATNVELYEPFGVAVDTIGNLFIADTYNNRIRKVDTNGVLTTVAGKASHAYSGDGQAATNASLNYPHGVALDAAGNLFIADQGNNRIRKVDTNGVITTVAGSGSAGYSGDGGAATNAKLNGPFGIALDVAGNLFIADTSNNRIRKVDTNGQITTVAGNGVNSYSGDGAAATNAGLDGPCGVAVDSVGNLFIADTGNNRIRQTGVNGIMTTLAGVSGGGYFGDGNSATYARLQGPTGIAADNAGNVFIADQFNDRVRKIGPAGPNLTLSYVTGVSAGSYSVVVSNGSGSVTSQAAVITVVYPPAISAQPQSQVALNGRPVSLSVSATGTPALSFQWQHDGVDLADGGSISGSTASNLLISAMGTNNSGGYVVVVTNAYGAVTSAVATLSTAFAPSISTTLTNLAALRGGSTTLSVAAAGTGPLTYEWFFNDTNLLIGDISTAAGNGTNGFSGDGGAATNAELGYPGGIAADAAGNLFIADPHNNCLRKVDATGVIKTVAGNGAAGYTADGVAATNSELNAPYGVALDNGGNLFIADFYNNLVRKVDVNGMISTVAGNGVAGYSGDGGSATNAKLNQPFGLAVDSSGNLFILDQGNVRIRKVSANGVITTVAGNGTYGYFGDGGPATNAELNSPDGVALDLAGNLFIADGGNGRIRKVDTNGVITTVAGHGNQAYSGDGGAATNADLDHPYGVALDPAGNLFIADGSNNRIRKMDTSGFITTVAGNGAYGYSGDGGPAANAELSYPSGVAINGAGVFFIGESDYRVRKVSGEPNLTLSAIDFTNAGSYSVVVSSPYGSVTSQVAVITVYSAPFIIAQPQSQLILNSRPASLSVSAAGTPPFFYQWQQNGMSLMDEGNVSGSTTSNLLINAMTTNDNGGYVVIVTNAFGSVTSAVATLTTTFAPSVLTQPTNLVVVNNGSVTLNVSVAGTPPFTYQWFFNATNPLTGTISTVAGNGTNGFSGDGGGATGAALRNPGGVIVDAGGNLFIADTDNNRIRKVDANGIITTVAGNGSYGFSGDGGLATNAELASPNGVAADSAGNLFIADTDNNRIRKVDTNGVITTLAGSGGFFYSGDGGAATNGSLFIPYGVAVDAVGNLFIADTDNNRIRKVDTNGVITTVAGNQFDFYSGDGLAATNSGLYSPEGVAVDTIGNLFIADIFNVRIRKVDTNGLITTVAGNGVFGYFGDGGPATNAGLPGPRGVAVDAAGNLFIAESYTNVIREVDTNGVITTIAGKRAPGFSGDGGLATNAELSQPTGVALDGAGNLFIADFQNNRIRKMTLSEPNLILNKVTFANAGSYSVVVSSPYTSVTNQVAVVTVALPPLSANIIPGSGGGSPMSVQFGFTGQPGSNYLLQFTTNLSPPVVWQPFATQTADTNGNCVFTDTNAAANSARYYRIATP